MRKATRWLLRYGVAFLAVTLALASLGIPVVGRGGGSILFFAVLVSAWYGGLGPGLFATAYVVAVALLVYRVNLPAWRVLSVGLFLAGGAGISVLVEALHAARRRAEASEAWLSAVLKSIGDAVIVTEGQGRVRFINSVAERLTGWSQEESRERALSDVFRIINEETRQPTENPVEKVIKEGAIVGLANHTILIAKDGAETCIDDSAAPIKDDRGRVGGVVLVFRDVTHRIRTEREKEQLLAIAQDARAEAEAANRAKDEFLAVLSHELRTPLTPLLLSVSAMLDDPETSDDMRPILEMTRHNVELEARLIDDLLDLTRIVRGKMQLNKETINAHALIQWAVGICSDEIQTGGLRLAMDLDARDHHVEGDPARLQQVLWNLIKNSVKFTPPHGQITIRSRNERDGNDGFIRPRLVIEIVDTGIGIEPEHLPKVFDAFAQGNDSLWSRQFGGLGLGLAISRSIVHAHGGRISAASPGRGQGATFKVDLDTAPAPASVPQRQEPPPGEPAQARSLKILLVEDDEATLRTLARLLRQRRYEVATANTLASALELAVTEDFSLVISDIGLPDGNGLELMRKLRAQCPVKGIALSGYGMERDVQRSKEAGFAEHLTKPIHFQELDAAIQRMVC